DSGRRARAEGSADRLEARFGGFALAAPLLDEPFGWSATARDLASCLVGFLVAHDGFDVFGVQRAAAAVAAQRAPIRDAAASAAVGRVKDARWGQRLAVAFDRAGKAPAQEALQLGQVDGPTTRRLVFPRRLG